MGELIAEVTVVLDARDRTAAHIEHMDGGDELVIEPAPGLRMVIAPEDAEPWLCNFTARVRAALVSALGNPHDKGVAS